MEINDGILDIKCGNEIYQEGTEVEIAELLEGCTQFIKYSFFQKRSGYRAKASEIDEIEYPERYRHMRRFVNVVPRNAEAVSCSVEAVSCSVEAVSCSVETDPNAVETDPNAVEIDPNAVEIDPNAVETDPCNVETDPRAVETDPCNVETDPRDARSDLRSAKALHLSYLTEDRV